MEPRVVFKPNVKGKAMLSETLVDILSTRKWSLDSGKYLEYGIGSLLHLLDQCHASHILLQGNSQPDIIKDISCIQKYPQLLVLNLTGNKIESIEVLWRMEVSSLKQLLLSENQISQIRSIRKWMFNFGHLDYLSLEKNPIKNLNALPLALNHNNSIIIEIPTNEEQLQLMDIHWTAKVPPTIELVRQDGFIFNPLSSREKQVLSEGGEQFSMISKIFCKSRI